MSEQIDKYGIHSLNKNIINNAQLYFDSLIKPVGSLGKLEALTCRFAAARQLWLPGQLPQPKLAVVKIIDAKVKTHAGREALLPFFAQSVNAEIYTFLVDTKATRQEIFRAAFSYMHEISLKSANVVAFVSHEDKDGKKLSKELLAEKSYQELLMSEDVSGIAMVGCILGAAKERLLLCLEGSVIIKAACLACKMAPEVLDYCFLGQTNKEAVQEYLAYLKIEPLLNIKLTNGFGYGAILAFSLLEAGVKSYKEMATFTKASVHGVIKEYTKGVSSK